MFWEHGILWQCKFTNESLFHEQFSASNWQYPGFWPHTKNGFSYALIIPSSRSENVGIHVLLSGRRKLQGISQYLYTCFEMVYEVSWVRFLVHFECGRLIYWWSNYWSFYITSYNCTGTLNSFLLWLWVNLWLALPKRIWQKRSCAIFSLRLRRTCIFPFSPLEPIYFWSPASFMRTSLGESAKEWETMWRKPWNVLANCQPII